MKDIKKFRWFSCVLVAYIVLLTGINEVRAQDVAKGICGTSNGAPFTVAPTTNLCDYTGETTTIVNGTGPWSWTCTGASTDYNVNCWAYVEGTLVLPKTRQVTCYGDINVDGEIIVGGEIITCAGTGQDGDKQMGAVHTDSLFTDNGDGTISDKVYSMKWEKDAGAHGANIKNGVIGLPVPRFTDNQNGTMTDNLTGLIWLKNANCANHALTKSVLKSTSLPILNGPLTWQEALTWSNNLKGDADGTLCGLQDNSIVGDWRLPNINELASLLTNYSTGVDSGITPSDWLNNATQGFTNVPIDVFWSSTNAEFNPSGAWGVNMGTGLSYSNHKSSTYYVLPVRGGQSGSVAVLTLTKDGTGTGIVSSTLDKISCGETCSAGFPNGQEVELTAAASTGSTFTGWSDSGCTSGNTCIITVTGAKSVTATFTMNSYNVTFNSIGGSAVATQSVDHNSTANAPTSPAKDGYTFVGWYSNVGLTSAFDFTTPITSAITLYAKWAIINYTVSFNSNGGTDVTSLSVPYDTKATAPTAPTKPDYAFSGWYSNEALTSPFSFTTAITGNTPLYAKWTYNLFSVTPSAGSNSSISPSTVQTKAGGTTASFTILPTATGYGVYATGCNGSLSGSTYTTAAITGNCTVTVTAVKRNANSGNSASPTAVDALKALQAYYGGLSLSAEELIRYDVAPLVNGVPQGDGKIDLSDVILILRRSIGVGSW